MMNEITEGIQNNPTATGSVVAGIIVAAAWWLPKLLNGIKVDKVDGSILDRLLAHEKRMNDMDTRIHAQRIQITRLQVLVVQMEALMKANGIKIPSAMRAEIAELLDGDQQQAEALTDAQ